MHKASDSLQSICVGRFRIWGGGGGGGQGLEYWGAKVLIWGGGNTGARGGGKFPAGT